MKLVDWRHIKNITQHDFGQMLGVMNITVSRWERGTRIPAPNFQRKMLIATEGEVTPNDWIDIAP